MRGGEKMLKKKGRPETEKSSHKKSNGLTVKQNEILHEQSRSMGIPFNLLLRKIVDAYLAGFEQDANEMGETDPSNNV
jgi:hypothetical protein